MRQMKVGDRSFFYESVKQPGIVGILKVTRSFYPDPTDKTGKFGMVDFKAIKPLPRKLALAELRSHEAVAELALFRQSRLSVMPVPAKVWAYLIDLAARPG